MKLKTEQLIKCRLEKSTISKTNVDVKSHVLTELDSVSCDCVGWSMFSIKKKSTCSSALFPLDVTTAIEDRPTGRLCDCCDSGMSTERHLTAVIDGKIQSGRLGLRILQETHDV